MNRSLKPCTSTSSTLWDAQNHNFGALVDRLTSLPDELLIRILSLLPTKYAAATCVLSRTLWRVFPFITTLDFDVSPVNLCSEHPYAIERYPTFVRFIDTVIQAHKSKYLTRFRLQVASGDFRYVYSRDGCNGDGCKQGCLPDLKLEQLDAWISFPLTLCGLRELDLCILVRTPRDGDAQPQLPSAIFTCETLEVLKLEVNIGLDQVITMPSYRLPNLKLLLLSASFVSDDNLLPRLVSSCPLLEDLTFEAITNHVHHTTVVSTSLQRLCLRVHKVDSFLEDNTDLVLIDTPNLEYLTYSDNLALWYSFPAMHRLVEANLWILGILQWEILFRQCLASSDSFLMFNEFDCAGEEVLKDQLPVFPNLKYLVLGRASESYFWNKLKLPLLNCSPVLETLVFEEGFSTYYDAEYCPYEREPLELELEFFRTAHAIPLCCRHHLKKIVIKDYNGVEREVEMIQFLLRHALVLEELVVCLSEFAPVKISVENTLNNLQKASVTCSIQVLSSPWLSTSYHLSIPTLQKITL